MKKGNTMTAYAPLTLARPAYPHAHLPLLTAMDVPSTTLLQTLWQVLSVKRPHGGVGDAHTAAWLANRVPLTMIDPMGNLHVDMRGKTGRTMFTAHIDTVHYIDGVNSIRLDVNSERTLWRADAGSCLGADDGAGIALMLHMIDVGVRGYYVFFRGEECGGEGSTWLSDNWDTLGMGDIAHCVSFDRADQMDVITHQAGGRCCSDVFAQALADALTLPDLSLAFAPDSTGVFTDSANLTSRIPECTNLSVGYKHQHGDGEYQDVTFLTKLADRLCKVDWDALPVERDPKAKEFLGAGMYSRHAWAQTPVHDDPMGFYAKGTDVPFYMDADEEYLYDCLEDFIWGKSAPLEYAVADALGVDVKDVDLKSLKSKEASRLSDGLADGKYTASAVYAYISDVL